MQIDARFYETYEMCDIISRVIRDPSEHLIKLEAFHCDGNWTWLTNPFEKYSALHKFIEYIVREVHAEQANAFDLVEGQRLAASFQSVPAALVDMQPEKLPIEFALDHYGISYKSFTVYLEEHGKTFQSSTEDDVYCYMQDTWLTEAYDRLLDQIVKEVFHILFQNRILLLAFNEYVASIVACATLSELESIIAERFRDNGTLKRYRPPIWAQRAVFYRDRGRCVLCDKDLTGLSNIGNIENYDHIVPLVRFGLNDVSNLQLLCVDCNQREKSGKTAITSSTYQSWYKYG